MEGIGKARIRIPETIRQGELVEIKALIRHPMETGLRKDKKSGAIIPAHFITEVEVTFKDRPILTATWGPAIAQDPYMAFFLRADGPGVVKITWKDNQGGVYSETANLTPKP
ncbi:MAG: thiosulfate oxidation carrier complex protein SoxZ [Magnetococcales bacterium]|nr:thiosulfate oxidation carrier complex protein SoxZ [Magnetococcales bacterium]